MQMLLKQRSKTIEILAVAVAFVIAFSLFFTYKMVRTDQMRGDTAMYLQGTENLAARGVPMSQVQAGIIDFLNHNTYTTTPAAEIAANPRPLLGSPAPMRESSIMLGHAYFILYPVALFVKMFPVRTVLMVLFAATFLGMLVVAYALLRSRGVAAAAALVFCAIIVSHPVWWQGLLWGQFYPDRVFLFFGMLLMWLASREQLGTENRQTNRFALVAAGIACASVNERGALISGLFLGMYALLYWRRPQADNVFKLVFGAALVVYGYVAIKFIVPTDLAYGTFLPTNWAGLIATVQAPRFMPMVLLFVLVNLPLLVLAAFEWRAAVIAAIFMIPNIFGNIGGAEKLGWPTHYPTFYFAPLVWAAATGYAHLFDPAAGKKRLLQAYALAATGFAYLNMLDPITFDHLSFGPANIARNAFPTMKEQFDAYVFQSPNRIALENAVAGIQHAVPEGSTVSSIEAGMPLLFHNRTVEFFPKDIDNADYLLLGASQTPDGKIAYNGVVTALGPAELQKLNDLVVARMKLDGFDVDHPQLFPAFAGTAVVRRLRAKH